jgi:hypothetical protein
MKTNARVLIVAVCLLCLGQLPAMAQGNASIKEFEKEFTTYPFSQPNPVANPGNIYPYYRFDGFTDKSVKQKWKVVELENDFIKLWVMPQIGGKIWTAIDKKNGRPFIYQNDVVKFRDIAMRGPWTSGGIESNFGIIGHTPGVSGTVDYLTRKNVDGSVSCIISLLDLLTQTRWNLEIRLEKDKAYFTTHAFWHNGTGEDQPYYSWMNLAVKAGGDLKFIEPGTHHLFHDGKSYSWPRDSARNRDLSLYMQNDFGGSQSYHITGVYSKYWGAYWQKADYGMIHFAGREDKVGKKIFLWGLARSGAIWDKLLNDTAGQYTELQSGRLYNQNIAESVYSPYKQFNFSPFQTDSWTEYWYPYNQTHGVALADTNGVLNVRQSRDSAAIYFSAVRYISDTLKVMASDGKLIFSKVIRLKPLETLHQAIHLDAGLGLSRITLGSSELSLKDTTDRILSRPTVPLVKLDYESAYGLYLTGRYQAGMRNYQQAEKNISRSLQLDPSFIPALAQMAMLEYKKMHYQAAFDYARKAISLDTYDGEANYYYGLSALRLNKVYDAQDGFEVATLTDQYRSAAFTQLSKIKIIQQRFDEAFAYASKSLVYNSENITALQLQYLSARLLHNKAAEKTILGRISALDPFNHFIRFEQYWAGRSEESKAAFTAPVRDELPQQTYLELAVWYHELSLDQECRSILETAPQKNNEMMYWLAWLHRNDADASEWLDRAKRGSAYLVFPFRPQSVQVMQWALKTSGDWKPGYYQSLIFESVHDTLMARQAIGQCAAPDDFSPFYVFRARLSEGSADNQARLNDLLKAAKISPQEWIYVKYLTEFLITLNRNQQALATIEPFYKAHTDNYIMGMLYARCLMLNGRYSNAEKTLEKLQVLPYEGARDGHKLYEQTKLVLALELIGKGQLAQAGKKVSQARQWPENLGVGGPYPQDADDSLENLVEGLIARSGRQKPSEKTLSEYLARVKAIGGM